VGHNNDTSTDCVRRSTFYTEGKNQSLNIFSLKLFNIKSFPTICILMSDVNELKANIYSAQVDLHQQFCIIFIVEYSMESNNIGE